MWTYWFQKSQKIFLLILPTGYILLFANVSVGFGSASVQDQFEDTLQQLNVKLWTVAQNQFYDSNQPLDLLDLDQPGLNQTTEPQTDENLIEERSIDSTFSSFGTQFDGIWGLSESVCDKTQSVHDIVDSQSMAIQKNQILFSDSKCLITQSEGDFLSGHQVKVNCLDADNQRFETEIFMKPLGALKLEISTSEQASVQYIFCSGISTQ